METDNDHVLASVKWCVLDGWPPRSKVEDALRQFYSFRDDLHIVNSILFKKRSIIIPSSLRKEMLQRMHAGHLGISKTKQLVRSSIYWPGLMKTLVNVWIPVQPVKSSGKPIVSSQSNLTLYLIFHGRR